MSFTGPRDISSTRLSDMWVNRTDLDRGYFALMETFFIPEDPTLIATDDPILAQRCGRGQWSPVSIGWTPKKPTGLFSSKVPESLVNKNEGRSPVQAVVRHHDVIVSIPDFIITYVELNSMEIEELVVASRPVQRSRTLTGLLKMVDEWAGAREHFENKEAVSAVAVKVRDWFEAHHPELLAVARAEAPDTEVAATITGRPVEQRTVEVPEVIGIIAQEHEHDEDTGAVAARRRDPARKG